MDSGKCSLEEEIISRDFNPQQNSSPVLNEYLPPWGKANASERREIILLAAGVYFPMAFTLIVISLFSLMYIALYLYPSSIFDQPRSSPDEKEINTGHLLVSTRSSTEMMMTLRYGTGTARLKNNEPSAGHGFS